MAEEISKRSQDFRKIVTDKLIAELEKGTAPWQRPWQKNGDALPFNPVSGTRYRGGNLIWLMAHEGDDPRWMTYKQAQSIGAQVRKGEKGTFIQYWKWGEERIEKDAQGLPVIGPDGKPKKTVRPYEDGKPRIFRAVVFNAAQIDGLPELNPPEKQKWDNIARAEALLKNTGAVFRFGSSAYYMHQTDEIHLPEKTRFDSAERFYSTALHELGHWTGHETRLNRPVDSAFGSDAYAKEELRAEIASMILSHDLRLAYDTQQHAAYIGAWLNVLKKDPNEIFRAAADAEKIYAYIKTFDKEKAYCAAREAAGAPAEPAEKGANAVPSAPNAPTNPAETKNGPARAFSRTPDAPSPAAGRQKTAPDRDALPFSDFVKEVRAAYAKALARSPRDAAKNALIKKVKEIAFKNRARAANRTQNALHAKTKQPLADHER